MSDEPLDLNFSDPPFSSSEGIPHDVVPKKESQAVLKKKKVSEIPRVEQGPALELQEPHLDARGPWVKYIGIATLRIMDAEAWRSAGVTSSKYVEWNYLNNMKVPVSVFNQKELDYLLGRDGRFIKVD